METMPLNQENGDSVDIPTKINDLVEEEEIVGGVPEEIREDINVVVGGKGANMLDIQVKPTNSEIVSETASFLEDERNVENEHAKLENLPSEQLSSNPEPNDLEVPPNNDSEGEPLTVMHDEPIGNSINGEENNEIESESPNKEVVMIEVTDEAAKLELHISEADLVENSEQEPEHPDKLELHISETDLHDNDDSKDCKEAYSCQSSPGYIKPASAKSGIVKQKSLDTQVTSDDESESSRVKRGSLHSPSSKIITKMTPITWDQWMKRPASYIPPQKSPSTESASGSSSIDGKSSETKVPAVGESPKVKKTRFQIIPQTVDVLEISRDEAKPLDTFDETEEDEFLMKNPNMLLDSHLNQLTMVESQLKKLGAAAKAGSKKLAQTQETDSRAMKRTSSAEEKGKGWLGWLSVFTKKAPPSPSPAPKKQQQAGGGKRAPRKTRRLAAPPLLPEYPKIVYITEVGYLVYRVECCSVEESMIVGM